MSSPLAASMIVTCKGRISHLRQTLPAMLGQQADFPFEVLVVDYGDPDRVFDWCRRLSDPRIAALRVHEDVEHFNQSRARNCGARHALGSIFAFVDADISPHVDWLSHVVSKIRAGHCGLCRTRSWSKNGTAAVASEVYDLVRGYDESMAGWGYEDDDFYKRCSARTHVGRFSARRLDAIEHTDLERVRYYQNKDIRETRRENGRLGKDANRVVNPSGHGLGVCTLWRAGAYSLVGESSVEESA